MIHLSLIDLSNLIHICCSFICTKANCVFHIFVNDTILGLLDQCHRVHYVLLVQGDLDERMQYLKKKKDCMIFSSERQKEISYAPYRFLVFGHRSDASARVTCARTQFWKDDRKKKRPSTWLDTNPQPLKHCGCALPLCYCHYWSIILFNWLFRHSDRSNRNHEKQRRLNSKYEGFHE